MNPARDVSSAVKIQICVHYCTRSGMRHRVDASIICSAAPSSEGCFSSCVMHLWCHSGPPVFGVINYLDQDRSYLLWKFADLIEREAHDLAIVETLVRPHQAPHDFGPTSYHLYKQQCG